MRYLFLEVVQLEIVHIIRERAHVLKPAVSLESGGAHCGGESMPTSLEGISSWFMELRASVFTHHIFQEVLGEESGLGLSLAVPPCKGELKMPDSWGSQSSLARALPRVPSKPAVLVQLAYNNPSPHMITAKRSAPLSPIETWGQAAQWWSCRAVPESFSATPRWMRGRIELPFLGWHSLKQKRGGESAFLSLLENILEVA